MGQVQDIFTNFSYHLRKTSLDQNSVFCLMSVSIPSILSRFSFCFCTMKKRQMTLGTELALLNGPKKYYLTFKLGPRVTSCLLKPGWITFQKPKKCFVIRAKNISPWFDCEDSVSNFQLRLDKIPKSFNINVQKIIGMHHRNKSMCVTQVKVCLFCTLLSHHKYLKDMLKTLGTR